MAFPADSAIFISTLSAINKFGNQMATLFTEKLEGPRSEFLFWDFFIKPTARSVTLFFLPRGGSFVSVIKINKQQERIVIFYVSGRKKNARKLRDARFSRRKFRRPDNGDFLQQQIKVQEQYFLSCKNKTILLYRIF